MIKMVTIKNIFDLKKEIEKNHEKAKKYTSTIIGDIGKIKRLLEKKWIDEMLTSKKKREIQIFVDKYDRIYSKN